MSLYADLADVVVQPKEVKVSTPLVNVSLRPQKTPTVKSEKSVAQELYDNFSTVNINQQLRQPTTKISLHHIIQQTDKARDERFHRQKAGSGSQVQSNTVYVGNLRWWVTDQDLWNLFSQFGVIGSLKIHADKVNGKSKGYGYIQFEHSHPLAAALAREKLNGYHLEDNGELRVEFTSKDKIQQQEFHRSSANKRKRGGGVGGGVMRGGYPGSTSGRTKFKQVMCKNIVVNGHCRFGAACTYKHGPNDTAQNVAAQQAGLVGCVNPENLMISPHGRKRVKHINYGP